MRKTKMTTKTMTCLESLFWEGEAEEDEEVQKGTAASTQSKDGARKGKQERCLELDVFWSASRAVSSCCLTKGRKKKNGTSLKD